MFIQINETTIINLDNIVKIKQVNNFVTFYSNAFWLGVELKVIESYEMKSEQDAKGLIKNITKATQTVKVTYS